MASSRFSEAISEGDGISVVVEVHDLDSARAAAAQGAEALVIRAALDGVRDACDLPILWRGSGPLTDAMHAGADACLVVLEHHAYDGERLEELHAEADELGLDCVIEVRNEEELDLALERLDPEIFLLAATPEDGEGELASALSLLADIPAGKLAVADVRVSGREEVVELERAGVDAVIVGAGNIAELVGDAPPEV
jgi:indole-3-glycerol phosphate synthase